MNNTTKISTIKSLFFEVVCRKVNGEENFCMEFIHLEKVYDIAHREVLKWALMKKEIPKTYIVFN